MACKEYEYDKKERKKKNKERAGTMNDERRKDIKLILQKGDKGFRRDKEYLMDTERKEQKGKLKKNETITERKKRKDGVDQGTA